MGKKSTVSTTLLLIVLLGFLQGCAGQGKEIKTIKGDPEVLYRQGLERFNKRDYSEALEIFQQIKSSFPDSPPYTQWAEIKVGDCHFFKKEYVEAIAAYEEFKRTRPTHEDIPYVLFQIGMSYFQQMRPHDRDQTFTQKALSNFEYLVANTPPTLLTEKALEKIEICKKQLADHEFYIGNFYFQKGKFQAAASRFEGLLDKFPKRTEEDKTLFLLGKSYLELNQWEKARATLTRLVSEYPRSAHIREAKMLLSQGAEGQLPFQRVKAKETKKKEVREEKKESLALIKYDEEGRRPVPVHRTLGAGTEKEFLPSTGEPPASGTRPTPSDLPPPKERMTLEIGAEDEKRMAVLSPSPLPAERRGEPGEGEGVEEIRGIPKQAGFSESKEIPLLEEMRGEPIEITSERVEGLSKENRIFFKGNVIARQKDMVIYSDSLEALLLEDGRGIERVVADGNVRIQQGIRMASCGKAVFLNRDQKIFLSGEPKMWEGENMVTGEEIIFDLAKNRIEVRGGPGGRGKVRVHPEGELSPLK